MSFTDFVAGAIATRSPIRRDFEFEGQPITGWFLDLPALQVRELLRSESTDRDAAFLAAIVADEQGHPLLTLDQARSLKAPQMNALITEAFHVLGLTRDGRDAAKKP